MVEVPRPTPAPVAVAPVVAPPDPAAPQRGPRTLHIGSIEVRIQPSPAPTAPTPPAQGSSSPPAPRAALARGFVTPLGLRQG